MEEITINPIAWSAPEYTHRPREVDTLWTIGLIAIISAGIAIWLHNFLFAIFIVVSAFCLILFTVRTPHEIEFTITSEGMTLGRDKYSWKKIEGFHIKKHHPYDKLMVVTTNRFLPLYTIPLPTDLTNEVKETLILVIPNIEMEESQSTLFMEKLGF